MKRQRWTAADIPDLTGRTFVVTGANSGLGLATTHALAARGGHVTLAVRDEEKGRKAVAGLLADRVDVRRLDLTDLDSVDAFATGLAADHERLDVLVNNAGVMGPPRTLTADGHELHFAANHLGHFALALRLLGLLDAGRDPRVVTVSSFVHRRARMRFDDLTGEHGYSPMGFYNMSKLANTIFGLELHRRLTAAGSPVASVLAHPGYSATNMQTANTSGLTKLILGRFGNALLAQPAERGAWPQLFAATDPGVVGGEFIGPDGMGEARGHPKRVLPSADALDEDNGRRLWEVSARATGLTAVA